ncbi:hypothetical protein A2U01_0093562, partial [Trifolium medium]|nr:hypothetical protein [Trifolium medium]
MYRVTFRNVYVHFRVYVCMGLNSFQRTWQDYEILACFLRDDQLITLGLHMKSSGITL